MTRKQPTDLAASVRQRLLNLSRLRGEELQLVLTRYGVERLLYRMGRVSVGERFVLKGAVLFTLWDGAPHRPTRDVDFLGIGDPSLDALTAAFREICEAEVEPDGLLFRSDIVRAEPIRDRQEYGGARVTLVAMLGAARIPIQVDVGFGDAVTPAPEHASFPTLLDFPAPVILAYPAATVVAEKFEAMVSLGIANTRLKDFYDVWVLSETRDFDGPTLTRAIAATFARRGTALPESTSGEPPIAFALTFANNPDKRAMWRAFLTRLRLTDAPADLTAAVDRIAQLVLPPAAAVSGDILDAQWSAGFGWTREVPAQPTGGAPTPHSAT